MVTLVVENICLATATNRSHVMPKLAVPAQLPLVPEALCLDGKSELWHCVAACINFSCVGASDSIGTQAQVT